MSDFDMEDQGSSSEAASIAALQKKIDELERDNAKYREERRRAEFVSKYGESIADEVADLPEEKREAWAEKLLKLQTPAAPEADEPAPEPETAKVEVPAGLAAVSQAPAVGAPESQKLTPEEFKQYVNDMGLVAASQQYGHMVQFPDVENPLVTGQAAQVQGTYRPPS